MYEETNPFPLTFMNPMKRGQSALNMPGLHFQDLLVYLSCDWPQLSLCKLTTRVFHHLV